MPPAPTRVPAGAAAVGLGWPVDPEPTAAEPGAPVGLGWPGEPDEA